ncbi:MAG: amidophosphoribosyltransferase, partial [Proteobacteria bacterium]|nr:amidophosphoribosyltransferase [Pseudomonadota bacterium]
MGGLFGSVSNQDCSNDLFYGTDYHSHLGTKRGGLAVKNGKDFSRSIHNIENDYFRSKFESDMPKLPGNKGIGVISDHDPQPLIIGSHLGTFAIVTVCKINNIDELAAKA